MPAGDDANPARVLREEINKAIATQNGSALEAAILKGEKNGAFSPNILRVALQTAAKKGLAVTARFLLEHGAPTDLETPGQGSPALFWAASQPQSQGHIDVLELLLDKSYATCPADLEWRDKDGRTTLMSAAWRGHKQALACLLKHGANVNAIDNEERTILHNLANDKRGKWDSEVVDMILAHPIDLDHRDRRGRTALHWAVATSRIRLIEQLLSRPQALKADVNATTYRGKTALHLACDLDAAAPQMVELLLANGVDPSARSDGYWTALHNSAGVDGAEEVIVMLLDKDPTLLNAQTSNGMTPLHFAAQLGRVSNVRCLLKFEAIKLNVKDAFYMTPLLRAAQEGHLEIVSLLAPSNNVHRMDPYARSAAENFRATVVDFRSSSGEHPNVVYRESVYDVLYGVSARKRKNGGNERYIPTNLDNLRPSARPGVKNARPEVSRPKFRWIHLPANNLAWAEALLTKAFIEEGCQDVDGFKALQKNFSQQHRGDTAHSKFMRPLCQRSNRGTHVTDSLEWGPSEGVLRSGDINVSGTVPESSPERNSARRIRRIRDETRTTSSGTIEQVSAASDGHGAEGVRPQSPLARAGGSNNADTTPGATLIASQLSEAPQSVEPAVSPASAPGKKTKKKKAHNVSTRNGSITGSGPPTPRRVDSMPLAERTTSGRRSQPLAGSNICLFMPYLHFETHRSRLQMREAIRRAETRTELQHASHHVQIAEHITPDETLIFAHLTSTTGLHLRRTLDQFYLHAIDTEQRDRDQVVYRYCRSQQMEMKVFMVDQLWLWMLGPELVITCFPQRWKQPKNDPLNVLDGVIEDINSKTRSPVQSVTDLVLLITARCAGAFDRHTPSNAEYQFLEMFENSIGIANEKETKLYSEFNEDSERVRTWLHGHSAKDPSSDSSLSPIHNHYPAVVDCFLNIAKETELLQEVKDIYSEISMIDMVLGHQRQVLPLFQKHICDTIGGAYAQSNPKRRAVTRRIEEQINMVESHASELDRMSRLAFNVNTSLLALLDLKQKQSNAFEARFARDQAASTARQGQVVMIFTVVTIVFLPMSFMAQFFTINIQQFERVQPSGNLELGYVTKYVLGIGLGISVVLVVLAFGINGLRIHRLPRPNLFARRLQVEREFDDMNGASVVGLHPLSRSVVASDTAAPVTRFSREMGRHFSLDFPRGFRVGSDASSLISRRARPFARGFQEKA